MTITLSVEMIWWWIFCYFPGMFQMHKCVLKWKILTHTCVIGTLFERPTTIPQPSCWANAYRVQRPTAIQITVGMASPTARWKVLLLKSQPYPQDRLNSAISPWTLLMPLWNHTENSCMDLRICQLFLPWMALETWVPSLKNTREEIQHFHWRIKILGIQAPIASKVPPGQNTGVGRECWTTSNAGTHNFPSQDTHCICCTG